MLSDIEILYPDDLIPIRIDYDLLRKKYPKVFEDIKLHLENPGSEADIKYELEYQVIQDTALKMEAVKLHKCDGAVTVLNNTDFMAWHGPFCDGYYIYSDNSYVYFIISTAEMQAGSLGIWDINNNNWLFRNSDELFCVQSVIYINDIDTFYGYIIWNYPCTPHGGEYLFVIGPERNYVEADLAPIAGFSGWDDLKLDIKKSFYSQKDGYIGYDSKIKILVTASSGNNYAYQF